MIGLPFLAGGETKNLIQSAAANSDIGWVVYVLYVSMALNAIYYLPISYRAFFKKADDNNSYKVPLTMNIAIIITTLLTAGFVFYKDYITLLTDRL